MPLSKLQSDFDTTVPSSSIINQVFLYSDTLLDDSSKNTDQSDTIHPKEVIQKPIPKHRNTVWVDFGAVNDEKIAGSSNIDRHNSPQVNLKRKHGKRTWIDYDAINDNVTPITRQKTPRSNPKHGKTDNNKYYNYRRCRKEQLVDSPIVCSFYVKGKCVKGGDCEFSHEAMPAMSLQLCKYYTTECCAKGDRCPYLHQQFPCRFYHRGFQCKDGDKCRYAHGDRIDEELLNTLLELGKQKNV